MKFVSVTDLRSNSAEIRGTLAGERELIVTRNGRPIAILAAVDESTLEESLSALRNSRLKETLHIGRGLWKDRDDLPDFEEMRRSMDRKTSR